MQIHSIDIGMKNDTLNFKQVLKYLDVLCKDWTPCPIFLMP